MYAATIDAGPYVGFLRAFGPPEVVPLDDFAGNVSVAEVASGFWECVSAVTVKLVTDATVAGRVPRLRWFAGEPTPFAQAQPSVGLAASHTGVFTFAVDVQESGVANGATIIAPIPKLLILPAWSVVVDVPGGVAGDAVSAVRVYRQRYRLIELEEL